MTADGMILDQRILATFDDEDKLFPPYYCPGNSRWSAMPDWSSDGQRYVYYYNIQGEPKTELYLGESHSPNVILLGTFEDSFLEGLSPPRIQWLGNDRLVYYDRLSGVVHVINLHNLEDASLGSFARYQDRVDPAISPSPDGEVLVIQSWTDSESLDFIIVPVDGSKPLSISESVWRANGVLFDKNFRAVWTDDSSRFAIPGSRDGRIVWIIISREGETLSILDGGEASPFGVWGIWTHAGERFLTMCNPVSRGRYGEYDICLVDAQSSVEQVFPYQRHWNPRRLSQLSMDDHFLYYILKTGPWVYPTELFRMNLQDGTHERVAEGLRDYSWTESSNRREYYDFSSINWSPDGEWMILNNSGPEMKLSPNSQGSVTTPLLCDPESSCHPMNYGSLVVLGAEWWQPPSAWNLVEPIVNMEPDVGEIVFEDEFSAIDPEFWATTGDISISVSDYGAGLRLNGNTGITGIVGNNKVEFGNGMVLDFSYSHDSEFICGLFDQNGNDVLAISPFPGGSLSWVMLNIKSPSGDYQRSIAETKANRWYTIFLRILDNNQLQVTLFDKSYAAYVGGFNIRLESGWSQQRFEFRCEVSQGTIDIGRYGELLFSHE